MHSRSADSSCAQPATLYPEDAQQPDNISEGMSEMEKRDVLSIADMGPRHGLISCLSGRLIFKRATVWRRTGFIWVDAPFGAMMRDSGDVNEGRVGRWRPSRPH